MDFFFFECKSVQIFNILFAITCEMVGYKKYFVFTDYSPSAGVSA